MDGWMDGWELYSALHFAHLQYPYPGMYMNQWPGRKKERDRERQKEVSATINFYYKFTIGWGI